MKKITIINAYGDKNIGDATILKVAISFIKEAHKDLNQISVLCESEDAIKKSVGTEKNISPFQLPYGYAIRSEGGKVFGITKLFRFIIIFINTLGLISINKLFGKKLPMSGFYSYISEIKEADLIVGMGGGYFITQSAKDYFGLLLTLLPVYVAKLYRKKIVFLPISFGPFATKSQEMITYQALRNTSVIARDQITFKYLEKIDKKKKIKLSFAPDLALFFNIHKGNIQKKLKSNYITLTAREWFQDNKKQLFFENELTHFVNIVWEKYKLQTKFIPMAKNQIEDNDVNLGLRIKQNLKHNRIFHIVSPKGIVHVQNIIKDARIAVCTRMHSAILATTVYTPFIAIGYGHKTLGLVKNLGLTNWYIDITQINSDKLLELFYKLNQKQDLQNYITSIQRSILKILFTNQE